MSNYPFDPATRWLDEHTQKPTHTHTHRINHIPCVHVIYGTICGRREQQAGAGDEGVDCGGTERPAAGAKG